MHALLRYVSCWCALFAFGWLLGSPSAAAAEASAAEEATLKIFNREITTFRSAFLGIPPRERARRTAHVINELLERDGSSEVAIRRVEQALLITLDGSMAIALVAGDIDTLQGETLEAAAQRAATALRQAAREARAARAPERLLRATGEVAAGSVVAVLILLGLRRARRASQGYLVALAAKHAGKLKLGGQTLLRSERLFELVSAALRLVAVCLMALLCYEWASFTLSRIPYTRPWGEQLSEYLVGLIGQFFGAIAGAIPNLVVALAIFFIARWVVGVSAAFFNRVGTGQIELSWLDPELVRPTRKITACAIWLFALAMAYPYLPGAQTEAFKGLSVLIGLMVSLGASSLVGQAAAGLILMYSRTLRVGEFVRIGDAEGTVMAIGMFSTRIRTGMGEELAYSNALILGSVTTNYSRAVNGPGYIVDTTVTIGYDTPWRQVEAMLIEAAKRTEGILAEPEPRVMQTALADFYVEYRLIAQAIPAHAKPRAEVLNALHGNIQDVFNEYGVQIMSPHYLGDPAQDKVVPRERWHLAPAAASRKPNPAAP